MAEQRVRSLLRHLSGSNAAAQRQAASTLAVVVIDEQHEQALAAAGGVPLVLQLAWGSSSPDVQANMAILLANLCGQACSGQGEGISSSLLAAAEAAGGAAAAVQHLSSRHGLPAQVASAMLLAFLGSLGPERCERIAAAGDIPALLRVLRTCGAGAGGRPSRSQETAQAAAASALAALAAGSRECAESIVAGGGVQLLGRCLASCSQDGRAEEEAARALDRLACVLPDASALCCAIPALVPLLGCSRQQTQLAAVKALHSLACNGDAGATAAINAAGAMRPLVQLLGSPVTNAAGMAVSVLGALVEDDAGATLAAIKAGAAPALVHLLGHASAAVQEAAASLACNLCYEAAPRINAALLAAGAPAALVPLLQRSGDPGVQIAAARALRNLTAGDLRCRQEAEAAGAIPALVAALGCPNEDVQEAAVDALSHLALEEGLLPALAAAGATGALQRLCGSSRNASVREAASHALDLAGCSNGQPPDRCTPATPSAVPGEPEPATAEPPAPSGAAGAAATGAAAAAGAAALCSAATSAAAEPPSAPPAVQPTRPPAPRICAAPGCGATRGLRRCGGCGCVRYCSEACSKAHWRAHKAECRRLQAERAAAAAHAASS